MDGFREIYERYYPDVHRFALFLTGDAARADDLTADTSSGRGGPGIASNTPP